MPFDFTLFTCLHHSDNITSLWPAKCHSIHCKTRYAHLHHNQTTQRTNLVCLKYTLSQSTSHSSLTQTRRTPINIKQHSKIHLVCRNTRHALSRSVSHSLLTKAERTPIKTQQHTENTACVLKDKVHTLSKQAKRNPIKTKQHSQHTSCECLNYALSLFDSLQVQLYKSHSVHMGRVLPSKPNTQRIPLVCPKYTFSQSC